MMARQLRADPAVMSTIVAAVFLCGLFLTATPLLFTKLADEALVEAVSTPEPQLRNISASLDSLIGASSVDDPLRRVRERGEIFTDAQMPESVQEIIEDQTWVVDSPQFVVDAMPGSSARPQFSGSRFAGTLMRFRYQEDLDDRVSLIAGSFPERHEPVAVELGHDCLDPEIDEDDEGFDCAEVDVPVFEVAITTETLEFLPVPVGGMLLLTPDLDDTAYFGIPGEDLEYAVALKISGLIEIRDPDDDFWFNDPRLQEPRIRTNADFTFVFATGLMSPDDYRRLLRETGLAHWTYQWRFFVDSDLIRQDTVDQLVTDLVGLQRDAPASSFSASGHIGINTKLPTFVADYRDRRDATLAMMSTSIAGLFVLTVALILMLSALASDRQRSGLVLLRNRGASRLQMGVTRATQGLVLTIPPAVLAFVLSRVFIDASSDTPRMLTSGLIAAATLAFVLAAGPVIFASLGMLQTNRGRAGPRSEHRLAWEVLVGFSAVVALVVVRRRGVVGTAGREADLLLALTPALLALAVGLLVMRLYPHLMRLLAYMGSRRRSLTLFVGFRRVLQQPTAARLPMLVMLIAVVVATYASVTRISINDIQIEESWQESGAAYRMSEPDPGSTLTGFPDFSRLDSFEAQAAGVRFVDSHTLDDGRVPPTVDLLFLEIDEYSAVARSTPSDPHFPRFMVDPPSLGAGTELTPIPAIVSEVWGAGTPEVGDVFATNLGGGLVYFEIGEVRDRFPAMPVDRATVVIDIRHLDALVRSTLTRPTVIYVRAGPSDSEEITDLVSTQTLGSVVISQAALLEEVHEERFTSGLDQGLSVTFWLAMLLAAVGAVSSLALGSWTRKQDLGYLRTQGLDRSQAVWLTVIEQLPAVVVASAVGVFAGVVVAVVLEPTVSLAAFTSGTLAGGISIDPLPIVLAASGVVLGLTLVSGIFGYVRRHEDLGGLLRAGGER